MFDVQVRFLVSGSPVGFHEFMDSALAEVARRVRGEMQSLPPVQTAEPELPWRAQEEDRKRTRPLAVGVDEAAKMLGVSVYTIRNYVAQRRIRSVRVGRRVLIPMEVLEKVMAEG